MLRCFSSSNPRAIRQSSDSVNGSQLDDNDGNKALGGGKRNCGRRDGYINALLSTIIRANFRSYCGSDLFPGDLNPCSSNIFFLKMSVPLENDWLGQTTLSYLIGELLFCLFGQTFKMSSAAFKFLPANTDDG